MDIYGVTDYGLKFKFFLITVPISTLFRSLIQRIEIFSYWYY